MSVIPLRSNPTVPVVHRDRSEAVLEILGEERWNADFLLETGYRLCASCGTWCEPVAVDPEVQCGRCLHQAIETALIRGVHFHESPEDLATRVYDLLVRPGDDPAPKAVS